LKAAIIEGIEGPTRSALAQSLQICNPDRYDTDDLLYYFEAHQNNTVMALEKLASIFQQHDQRELYDKCSQEIAKLKLTVKSK
jgi:hypothetical protein